MLMKAERNDKNIKKTHIKVDKQNQKPDFEKSK